MQKSRRIKRSKTMIFKTIFFAVIGCLSLYEIIYVVMWINGGAASVGCPYLFFMFGIILIFMISCITDIRDDERPNRWRYM